jgi:hypothetical protein
MLWTVESVVLDVVELFELEGSNECEVVCKIGQECERCTVMGNEDVSGVIE